MTETLTPPKPNCEVETAEGRKKAWDSLMWTDHGFIRVFYQNFHWIDAHMARAGQPSPHFAKARMAVGAV